MIVSWTVNILKLIRQHDAVRSIIACLPDKGRFILTMDGTCWKLGKFKYYVLAVGICFDGVSLPIWDKDLFNDRAVEKQKYI